MILLPAIHHVIHARFGSFVHFPVFFYVPFCPECNIVLVSMLVDKRPYIYVQSDTFFKFNLHAVACAALRDLIS